MADSSVNWKAAIWRINARLAIFCAFMRALNGDWVWVLWAIAGWLEWQIAARIEKQTKGSKDE